MVRTQYSAHSEKGARRAGDVLAIVLAGGRGERLSHLTDQQAKPALHFGAKYRVIDFTLSNCINSGIRKVGVPTQYCAYELMNHVQRTWGFLHRELGEFVEPWPAHQQADQSGWYSGTADAVFRNIELIRRHRPQHVLILAGDHVYKQDYSALIAEHISRDAEVTVSCIEVPRDEARRFGVMQVDDEERVITFLEKPAAPPGLPGNSSMSLASMGIYVFNTDVLLAALQCDARRAESAHDFGRNIIPSLVGNRRLYAHRFSRSCVQPGGGDPYWRDVGTPDSYWQANLDLLQAKPALDIYDPNWPLWTAQDQRPPMRMTMDAEKHCSTICNAMIAEGCIISGAVVRNAQLFSGVRMEAFSLVEQSVILQDCKIQSHARVRRAVLAAGCTIPAGMVIGEDAALDAQRFYCTPSGLTVVTPGMLAKLEAAPQLKRFKAIPLPLRRAPKTAAVFAAADPSPAVQHFMAVEEMLFESLTHTAQAEKNSFHV